MNPVDSGRIVRTYTQHIEGDPDRVFSLLCPVREAEWLEGWKDGVRMVHSESGLAEKGCVFETRVEGRPDTVWMITRHDPAQGVVEFFRVTLGIVATHLRIGVEAREDASSTVRISYTFTPLSPAGRRFVDETHAEEAFRRDMAFWEDSMNHWLRRGELLCSE